MNMHPFPQSATNSAIAVEEAVREFFRRVFLWMSIGLTLTGVVAYTVASSPTLVRAIVLNKPIFYLVLFAPLAIVFGMRWASERLSALSATGLFLLFSFVNGLTF